MVRCASESIGLANTIRDLGHKHTYESGQTLQLCGDWLAAVRVVQSNTWKRNTFGCSIVRGVDPSLTWRLSPAYLYFRKAR